VERRTKTTYVYDTEERTSLVLPQPQGALPL
jgi:hypothetical protein